MKVLVTGDDKIYSLWKLSNWCHRHILRPIASAIRLFIRIVFSADIPPGLTLGKGTRFQNMR